MPEQSDWGKVAVSGFPWLMVRDECSWGAGWTHRRVMETRVITWRLMAASET